MKPLPNLLIVDDLPENIYLLEVILRNVKVKLITALSGPEALAKTRNTELALAIIDVRMPGMDGFELAVKMNQERLNDKVPVIFLTASNFNEVEVFQGYNSGAVDYMSKPIDNHILLCKINIFLDLFKQKQTIINNGLQLKTASEELIRVNSALKKSERRLSDIMFSMADWVWEVDEKGVYTYSSKRGSDLLGISHEEIIGKTMFDFMPSDEVERASAIFSEIMSSKAAIKDFESWNIGKNGERICLLTNGVPILDEAGNFKGYRGIDKDITERKCAEAALQESEEKFRSVTQSANDAIITCNNKGIITDWNEGAERIFGYTEFEITGKNLSVILPKVYQNSYFDHIKRVLNNEEIDFIGRTFEISGLRKTGDQFPLELSLAEWETESGRFFTGIIRDISTRKQSDEALKQISTRLALAVRAGGVGVWDLDIVNNELLWDDRMFELYGIKRENFSHAYESWLACIHPDDLEKSDTEIKMAIGGEKEFDSQFRVCWPDGSVHNIRANAVVIRDETGEPLHVIGTNWDITNQKKLEEKLKSNEINFRTFFETLNDLILVANKQGMIIYVNDLVSQKLGFTKDELYKMHVLDLNPAEMRSEAEVIFGDMLALKRDSCPLPLSKKDGTRIPVETRIWFGKWNGEDCIFGLSKDLSSEQEALEKFNKIFDNNPALMAISTIPEGIFTDVNKTFLVKTGYNKDEVIGKSAEDLGLFIAPEKQKVASLELSDNGVLHNYELQIKTRSGQLLDGLFSGEVIENQEQRLFLTVMVDVSERKLAEDIVRESESNLAEAQRIAHIGSWEWDMIANRVKWSKEMFRVFDIDPETYNGEPQALLQVIHPEDVDFFTENMNRNISSGSAPELEYRVIHKDGSIHTIHAEGRMEYNHNGKPFRSIGTVQDITERKKAEKEIHQANNFLDSIVENIPNMIFIKDVKTLRYLRFNKAGENLLGISKDEILGKSDYDFFTKEIADIFTQQDAEVITLRKRIDALDEKVPTNHQGIRILHTKKLPIFNDYGDPEYLLGVAEDITDRKMAEQTLKVSEEKYRTMLNASPDGIFLIDFNGRITDVSEIGVELFGFENKEELLGKHFMGFVPSEGKKIILDIITKTMNEGIAQNIEMRIRKKNNSLFLSEASSTLIQGADGKPFSFMIIIRDISFRKKMETKQIHADRMANLGEMASGIAHEINQPLNIISMVMDKILFETAKTDFVDVSFLKLKSDKIFENITRIRNIIDHVRAFSRTHDDYVLTAFDINTSIENAASMIAEQFKHLGINLSLNLEKQIPQIVGNTYKFEQVIVNLLTNAKDAVIEKKSQQEESIDLSVGITSYQENKFLIVEIADNGIGIGNDDFHNIMLPFYTTKEEGKGTGLGLSICYQIIKEMDGMIDISSNKTEGTVIKLVLEIQKEK
ncbi:MAG: PAS domain S-box protein [Mariniphaga sp.]